jgi:hypothetical protein
MTIMWSFLTPGTRGALFAVTTVVMLTVGTHTALAQYGGLGPSASNPSSLSGGGAASQLGPGGSIKAPPPTPAALPGAAARSDRVAPSQGVVIADPTDALFDSVNRGDIATARDAIDRGADLDGRNLLGMTPLDLAVDLGRNDITFLLLSLRGADSRPRGGPGVQVAKAGQGAKAGQMAKAQTAKVQTAKAGKPAPSHASVAARAPTTAPATQAAPQLFAGNGGTPNPGVGFLGFDNRH